MEDEHRAKRFRVGDYRAVEVVAIDRNTEAPIKHGGEYKGAMMQVLKRTWYTRGIFSAFGTVKIYFIKENTEFHRP